MKDQDLLSIRQFSALTGIRQSTLRYYDKVKLFQPVLRGENGYRYYSAPQTIAVNFINVMHSLKIPIKNINGLKKKRAPKEILALLQKHEMELNQELFRLQQAYALIHTYSRLVQEGLLADEQRMDCRRMEAVPIELGPRNDFSSGYLYNSFFNFIERMVERNIDPAYPAGGFYENMEAFVSGAGKPTRYFSLVPAGRDTKEAGEYLVGYTRGYYGELGDLPQRMRAYAEKHALSLAGPVYEMYLHDEIAVDDRNQYLIQVSTPAQKLKA